MHHLQFCWLLLPWLPFLCPSLNIATTVRITHDVQYPSGNSCHSCYSYSKETNLLMEWKFWIAEPNSILLGTKACCDISFRISKNHLSVTCSAKCLCTPDDVECLEMLTAAFWADRLRIPSLATDETCLRTMPSPTLLTTRVVDVGRFFRIKLHRSRREFVACPDSEYDSIMSCIFEYFVSFCHLLITNLEINTSIL